MKKIKLIVLLVLGTVIMSNSTYAQSDPVVDFPPMPCNQFPICFTNYTGCDIEICFKLKVKFQSLDIDSPQEAESTVCKTIPAWGNVCISKEEFDANKSGDLSFPDVFDYGGLATGANGYQISHSITTTINSIATDYINPISMESYPDGGGYQVYPTPESPISICDGGNMKLNYIPGCPGRYTFTNL